MRKLISTLLILFFIGQIFVPVHFSHEENFSVNIAYAATREEAGAALQDISQYNDQVKEASSGYTDSFNKATENLSNPALSPVRRGAQQKLLDDLSRRYTTAFNRFNSLTASAIDAFEAGDYDAVINAHRQIALQASDVTSAANDVQALAHSLESGEPLETDPDNVTGNNGPRECFQLIDGYIPSLDPETCINQVLASLGTATLAFFGLFVQLTGNLFDAAIDFSISGMRDMFDLDAEGGASAINKAWTTFRDLANMAFIFILLYIAIGTILQLVDTKRLLVRVVIAALLINFSLFFTKILIDASNLLTITFHNKITAGGDGSLSSMFVDVTNLTTAYKVEEQLDFWKIFVATFAGSVFYIITAFVFLAGAILFVIRSVVLILLLILSPLAFAAMALPSDRYSSKWWDALWKQLIFAPMYIILIFVVSQILNGLQIETEGKGFADAFLSGNAGSLILNFAIVSAFMLAALIIANQIGATGSKTMMSWGKKLRGGIQGAAGRGTFGVLGAAGRGTFGKAAASYSENERLKEKAAQKGFGGSLARLQLKAARGVAGSSFDARATGITGKALGKSGGKGGYKKYEEEKAKKSAAFAKSLGPSDVVIDQAEEEKKRREKELDNLRKQTPDVAKVPDKELARAQKEYADMRTELETLETKADNQPESMSANEVKRLQRIRTEVQSKQAAVEKAQQNLEERRRGVQLEHHQQIRLAENELRGAGERVDELKGVKEDEAKKRARKDLKLGDKKEKDFTPEQKKAFEAKVKEFKKDSTATKRALAYAQSKEETSDISTAFLLPANRRWFSTKIKGIRKAEAAAIRKQAKGKSTEEKTKDLLKELEKETGEAEEKPEEGEGGGEPKTEPTNE